MESASWSLPCVVWSAERERRRGCGPLPREVEAAPEPMQRRHLIELANTPVGAFEPPPTPSRPAIAAADGQPRGRAGAAATPASRSRVLASGHGRERAGARADRVGSPMQRGSPPAGLPERRRAGAAARPQKRRPPRGRFFSALPDPPS
ncbi:hypothetical protein Pelo_17735 [Pelomyxa schiedti]|nr:hypothetical protein Pelo_17735 [Pelomyxa schiedti]